jgi:hypothetical protein
VMGKQIEQSRRTGTHQRGRNRPEMPAAMAESGEEIRRPRFISSGEMKGRKGRASWAFYSRVCLGDGLGFGARGEESDGGRERRAGGGDLARGGR